MFIHIMTLIKHMQDYKSNYDKLPATRVEDGVLLKGWDDILNELISNANDNIICIECYSGVYYEELASRFRAIPHALFIDSTDYFKSEEEIHGMTKNFMKDDVLFGYLGNLSVEDYIDEARGKQVKEKIASLDKTGNIIVFGYGSSTIVSPDILVYADMPRWEIQQRTRRNEVTGLGIDNRKEPF